MRRLLTCLLVVACGCGDANDADKGGQAGRTADGGSGGRSSLGGTGGKSSPAANGGSGGGGSSGTGGAGAAGARAGSGGSGGSGSGLGMIKLVPNIVAGKQSAGSGSGVGVGSQASALRVGSPSATSLLSLKYYITSIQLCEDAELMGSGFKSMSGCISLYQNMPAGSPDYNTYTVMQAKDDETPGRYVDLMSADAQAALRKPVTLQVPVAAPTAEEQLQEVDDADGGVPEAPKREPGVYRYGFINFYRPIKVKAEFPISGEPATSYFRTKAVTAIHESMLDNGFNMDRVEIGDTLNGATEETTYMLNNGGALFVFQKPFAITQADVEAKAQIFIDLVFNPENFGQAYVSDCANDVRVVVCDPANNVAIDMPYVHMSPVPRKQGERTRKETYLVDYDDNSKLRIELYYNDADSEASVQGVDTAIVYNSAAVPAGSAPSFNTVASNFVLQHGSISTNDASLSLLDYQRSVSLEDLVRRQDGTVTIHCLFPGSICTTLNEKITRAYTYVDDRVVSGN